MILKHISRSLLSFPFICIILLLSCIFLSLSFLTTTIFIIWVILNIMLLRKAGKICYFYSKHSIVTFCLYLFNSKNTSRISIHKVFKNEDNLIYEVEGCPCPQCQSKPVGYMQPRKRKSNSIVFICDQNSDHQQYMDPKEKLT